MIGAIKWATELPIDGRTDSRLGDCPVPHERRGSHLLALLGFFFSTAMFGTDRVLWIRCITSLVFKIGALTLYCGGLRSSSENAMRDCVCSAETTFGT